METKTTNENDTDSPSNNNSWLGKIIFYKWHILTFLVFLIQLWVIPKETISIRFGPKLIDSMFTYFSFNVPFFILSFLFIRNNVFKSLFFGQLFGGILMFVLWNRNFDIYYLINTYMDNLLVRYAMPFQFIQASIRGGSQLWAFMLSFYVGIILLIYGNWFVNKRKNKDGLWKIERQVLWTGLGVYGIINIMIWVFTHFSFVGSNYIYMHQSLKHVDQIVTYYDSKKEHNIFNLKELHFFKTKEDLLNYYKNPMFQERANQEDRIGFLNGSLNVIERFENPGTIENGLTYDKMERFHDWMSVVMNSKNLGQDKQKNTVWNIELSPAIYVEPQYQDVTRHSLMYVKKASDGSGYYSYIVFDRVFKDMKQNYFFNLMFGLFHLIFIPLFIYLLFLHKKNNLKNSAIVKQMKDIEQ